MLVYGFLPTEDQKTAISKMVENSGKTKSDVLRYVVGKGLQVIDPDHQLELFTREEVMMIYREMAAKELSDVEKRGLQVDTELERLAEMQDKVAVQIERLTERQDEIREAEKQVRTEEAEFREAKRLYDEALREFKEKHKDEIIEGVKADMKARISDSIRQCLQWVKEEHERGADLDKILRETPIEQFVSVN